MTKGRLLMCVNVALTMIILVILTTTTIASEVTKISKEELKSMLGNPDVIILDVDREGNWEDRDRKILGAVRENPKEIESWMTKYPKNKTFILY
jgi:hypothetical protein